MSYLGLGVVLQEPSFFQGNERNGTIDFNKVGTHVFSGESSFLDGNERNGTNDKKMVGTRTAQGLRVVLGEWSFLHGTNGTERTIQKKENSPSPGLTNILW